MGTLKLNVQYVESSSRMTTERKFESNGFKTTENMWSKYLENIFPNILYSEAVSTQKMSQW